MKTALIATISSVVTSLLTVSAFLWVLADRPIHLPERTLPDGSIERPVVNFLSGKSSFNVFTKDGRKLYTLVNFRDDPVGTSVLHTYNDGGGVTRTDVFTSPVSGGKECKVYEPNSIEPVASYRWTSIGQSGEQKKYFNASLTEISFDEFQTIRGIK